MSLKLPNPRGALSPTYWGDASKFGGTAKPRWEYRRELASRSGVAKGLQRRKLLEGL